MGPKDIKWSLCNYCNNNLFCNKTITLKKCLRHLNTSGIEFRDFFPFFFFLNTHLIVPDYRTQFFLWAATTERRKQWAENPFSKCLWTVWQPTQSFWHLRLYSISRNSHITIPILTRDWRHPEGLEFKCDSLMRF